MSVSFFGSGVLILGCGGMVLLVGGVLAFFLLRKKKQPRGFDVLEK